MAPSNQNREFRTRRARLLAVVAAAVLVVGGAGIAWTFGQQGKSAADVVDTTSGVDGGDAEASEADFETASLSPAVDAQITYVHAHWDDTESDDFGYLPENDCVNFASQSLVARGWETDDEWWYDESGDPYSSSDAWRSSTNLMWYLEDHPERATALTDEQRDQVKVGDLVQFDWDDSGDRDHTGIVTSVTTEVDGSITIRYAGHTDATFDRSVDWAITELHPDGVAYYWSIPE